MTSRPGDWIQVQCPTAFILTAYDISGVYNLCQNSPIGQNRTAASFYIVGSNDGTTWYPVDYKSGMVYPNATILHLYPTTTITTAFSYYRIIADHLAGEPYPIWNIANLNFYHNTTIYPPIQLTSAGVSGVSTTNKTVSGQAYGNGTYTFSTNITSYAVSNLTTNILGNVTVDTVGVYPFLDLTGHYNGDGSYNGSESTFVSNNPSPSNVVCFKEGSKILTDTGYKPIQDLRKGDLVQTFVHGYKAIDMIGKRDMVHIGSDQRIKDQLYVCTPTNYPELLEDLVITGCHSILVDDFKEGEESPGGVRGGRRPGGVALRGMTGRWARAGRPAAGRQKPTPRCPRPAQAPGGRKNILVRAALSISSGVINTVTVQLTMPPAVIWVASAAAVTLSGRSTTLYTSLSPKA